MNTPLVSVIVTTRNNQATLDACLSSIALQSYQALELIVVDRDSVDDTKNIASRYTNHVYNHGPERSAQRNFAVAQATGEYVIIVDSDMELSKDVVTDCVAVMKNQPHSTGIIIPEESFGVGFWAQCKRLERSFYHGYDPVEAARFYPKGIYEQLGGFDETMISGEDWDLSTRARMLGPVMHITAMIHHNEGRLSLRTMLKKKYYYAGQARYYLRKNNVGAKITASAGPLQRYKLFFSRPGKLFSKPLVGFGMLVMKTCEFGSGAVGYILTKPTEAGK
jgi:glycosyltransferase involved in cell wall biosynthesis